ncbi:MAG: ATP-dependent metallopeptidase FtsH/Yme1/Tma family protein, partial [Candidatus Omnitrophota bacterium]
MPNHNHKSKKNNILKRIPFGWIFVIIIFVMLINSFNVPISGVPKETSYSEFYEALKNNPDTIKSLTKTETILQGEYKNGSKFFVNIP